MTLGSMPVLWRPDFPYIEKTGGRRNLDAEALFLALNRRPRG